MSNPFAVIGMWEHQRPISAPLRTALEALEEAGLVLMVSAFGRGGGGLGAIGIDSVEILDRISTKGIDCDGTVLARVIDMVGGVRSGPLWGELAIYDGRGLARLDRIDGVGDLHDVLIDGDSVVAVSSASEQVIRIRNDRLVPSFDVLFESGSGTDMVHFNCLSRNGESLAVSAFGRESVRSWRAERELGRTDRGVVIEIASGRPIADGFCQPHSPRRWRDNWVIADAGNSRITIVNDDGTRRSIDCSGFTRGLHVHGDVAYVGVAPERVSMNVVPDRSAVVPSDAPPAMSRMLFVDLIAGTVVDELMLPFVEVYDLLVVPRSIVAGVRSGAAASALRLLERAAIDRLWPERVDPIAIDPIRESDREASIEIRVDGPLLAGSTSIVEISVTNRGPATLASVGSNRVLIGWWWGRSGEDGRGGCGLIAPIGPGETVTIPCPVDNPERPGIHRLGVGLVQEGVGQFGGTITRAVHVEESPDPDLCLGP